MRKRIRDDEGVVLIMIADHCEAIKLRLQTEGFNVEAYERTGQLICVTSEDLLAQFMATGTLDEELFRSTIGHLIERARTSGNTASPRRVRVFGEMDLNSQTWNARSPPHINPVDR